MEKSVANLIVNVSKVDSISPGMFASYFREHSVDNVQVNIDSAIIVNFFAKSLDYQNLRKEYENAERELQVKVKEGKDSTQILDCQQRLVFIERRLLDFERMVLEAAEVIAACKTNDQDIQIAKECFAQGDLNAAERILNRDRSEKALKQILIDEQQENQRHKKSLLRIKKEKELLSIRFLILAKILMINYNSSDSFEFISKLFEKSKKALVTKQNLFSFGKFLWSRQRYKSAQLQFELLISEQENELLQDVKEETRYNVGIAYTILADIYLNQERGEESEKSINKAIEIFKNLTLDYSYDYMENQADLYIQQGTLYLKKADFKSARENYKQAETAYEFLIDEREDDVLLYKHAVCFNNIGYVSGKEGLHNDALVNYQLCEEIVRNIVDSNPHLFGTLLALNLINQSFSLIHIHSFDTAFQYLEEAKAILEAFRSRDKFAQIQQYTRMLECYGDYHKKKEEFEEAIKYYGEGLQLIKEFSEVESRSLKIRQIILRGKLIVTSFIVGNYDFDDIDIDEHLADMLEFSHIDLSKPIALMESNPLLAFSIFLDAFISHLNTDVSKKNLMDQLFRSI